MLTEIEKNRLIKLLEDVADELDIDAKLIFKRKDFFATPSTRAVANVRFHTIFIDPAFPFDATMLLAITHEARHIYQYDNGIYDISEHTSSDKVDLEEYNLQQMEVDANAFARVYLSNVFGIVPLFQNMSDKVKKAIEKRAEEIIREEY